MQRRRQCRAGHRRANGVTPSARRRRRARRRAMMFADIALFPQEASTSARPGGPALLLPADGCGAVTLLVAFLLVYFCDPLPAAAGRGGQPAGNALLRAPGMVLDADAAGDFRGHVRLGAKVYFGAYRPPDDAATIYVVGKQWMWKFQHPEGQREINTLHVPARPADPPADDLGGRDPQPLHSRLPHPHGPAAGALHLGLVPGRRGRERTACSARSTAAPTMPG